jgi:hypothetical protein
MLSQVLLETTPHDALLTDDPRTDDVNHLLPQATQVTTATGEMTRVALDVPAVPGGGARRPGGTWVDAVANATAVATIAMPTA